VESATQHDAADLADKIAAEIAEAQANKRVAEARLSAQQISLAVDFAEKIHMYREANRNLLLLQEHLLPRARQSLEVARAAYLSGQLDFLNVIDAERTLFGFQLERVDAQTQRELALAEISLVIAGMPPAGAPILQSKQPIYSNLPLDSYEKNCSHAFYSGRSDERNALADRLRREIRRGARQSKTALHVRHASAGDPGPSGQLPDLRNETHAHSPSQTAAAQTRRKIRR